MATEIENEVVEETSIRDDITAAFDAAETETPASAPTESSAVAAATIAKPDDTSAPSESQTHTEDHPRDTQASPDNKTSDTTLHLPEKAPASWKPAIREYWGALPPDVKAEIIRREKEITRTLSDTTESRKFVQRFKEVSAPYKHIMAMESSDEIGAFENYLKTGAVLRQGTPWEKANSLAAVIKMFQIDPQLLDSALVGIMPPEAQQQQQPQQFRDPRLDNILQVQAQRRQQQLYQLDQEASADIAKFRALPTSEFFDDVEDLMSDILTMASRRNIQMSLQEAYDRATMIHPEIKKVLEARGSANSATRQSNQLDAARRRRMPKGGAPLPHGVQPAPSGSNSIRSDIEAAIDRLGSM